MERYRRFREPAVAGGHGGKGKAVVLGPSPSTVNADSPCSNGTCGHGAARAAFDANTLYEVLGGVREERGESWLLTRVEELVLTAAEHSSEKRGELSLRCSPGGGVLATVADSGPGIAATMRRLHGGGTTNSSDLPSP